MYEYDRTGSTWDGSGVVYDQVFRALARVKNGARILDAGCGNGHLTSLLAARGYSAHGIDPSESGVAIAREAHSGATFSCADLTRGLPDVDEFDAVVCIEVIEHVFAPHRLLATLLTALRPGGLLVLTTPYHGYLKNFLIVASGRFDRHFNPLWDHGHIKFFSPATLTELIETTGFERVSIRGIARLPFLWKTMMACAWKPPLAGNPAIVHR